MALQVKYSISFGAVFREGGSITGRGEVLFPSTFEKLTPSEKERHFLIKAKDLAFKLSNGKDIKKVNLISTARRGIVNF